MGREGRRMGDASSGCLVTEWSKPKNLRRTPAAGQVPRLAMLPFLLCILATFPLTSAQTDVDSFLSCISDAPSSSSVPSIVTATPTSNESLYATLSTRGIYPSPAPALVAQVHSQDQLVRAVECASSATNSICLRSGGHHFVGGSSCEGIQLDVHQLNDFSYNGDDKTITFGPGILLGELLYRTYQASGGTRMIGVGLCPSVGAAGYLLGGGHNPYSGKTGLSCDSMKQLKMVTPSGELMVASRENNDVLISASCGGGGGHFGAVLEFTFDTHDAGPFDRNTFFRFEWPIAQTGDIVEKWMDYDQDDGDSWVRLEINKGTGLLAYGVCWDVSSSDDCLERLSKHAFFNTQNRETIILEYGRSILEFQTWIGPAGDWGARLPDLTPEEALVDQYFLESGLGLQRSYTSSFLSFATGAPSADDYQKWAEICSASSEALWFTLCQFNPWKGRNLETPVLGDGSNPASFFAHRSADAFIELIQGNDSDDPPSNIAEEMKRIEAKVFAIANKYRMGIFNNYPEFGLTQKEYLYLYFGQSLNNLRIMRSKTDPDEILDQLQPIPSSIDCPGSLKLMPDNSRLNSFKAIIEGYSFGQLPLMEFSVQPQNATCTLNEDGIDPAMLKVTSVLNSAKDTAKFWTISVNSSEATSISFTGDDGVDCSPRLVFLNGIECETLIFQTTSDTTSEEPSIDDSGSADDTSETDEPSSSSADISPTAPAQQETNEAACFPSDAQVTLEGGHRRRMDELQIGDRVMTGEASFSKVYFFSHRDEEKLSTFVHASVVADSHESFEIFMSPGHYISRNETRDLVTASSLEREDKVLVINGLGMQISGVVRSLKYVYKRGLYNPHTLDGSIVVNNILVSTFTHHVNVRLATVALVPVRLWFYASQRFRIPHFQCARKIGLFAFGFLRGPSQLITE